MLVDRLSNISPRNVTFKHAHVGGGRQAVIGYVAPTKLVGLFFLQLETVLCYDNAIIRGGGTMRYFLMGLMAIVLIGCNDNQDNKLEKTPAAELAITPVENLLHDPALEGRCQCAGGAPSKTVMCSKPDGTKFTATAKCWKKRTALSGKDCGTVCASNSQACAGTQVRCQ